MTAGGEGPQVGKMGYEIRKKVGRPGEWGVWGRPGGMGVWGLFGFKDIGGFDLGEVEDAGDDDHAA